MSTDFQTLDKAKHSEKISFIGVVIKIGDLQSGTNAKGDYTYKRITIQDATANVEITAWNDDIKKFVMGGKYEILNAYGKEYKGSVGLGIQYAEVKLIGTDKQQATMDKEMKPEPAVGKPVTKDGLPEMSENLLEFIDAETTLLLQIEQDVKSVMAHYGADLSKVDGGKVGMFVKEIYREYKKIKFNKAS